MRYANQLEMFRVHFQDFIDNGDGSYKDGINMASATLITILSQLHNGDRDYIVAHLKAWAKSVEDTAPKNMLVGAVSVH